MICRTAIGRWRGEPQREPHCTDPPCRPSASFVRCLQEGPYRHTDKGGSKEAFQHLQEAYEGFTKYSFPQAPLYFDPADLNSKRFLFTAAEWDEIQRDLAECRERYRVAAEHNRRCEEALRREREERERAARESDHETATQSRHGQPSPPPRHHQPCPPPRTSPCRPSYRPRRWRRRTRPHRQRSRTHTVTQRRTNTDVARSE
ncbi:unnamed protein product [Vitrella brassicaformis CCMP3155]|uniref:Uncharacterized protein n=1 Tax=Vitrella brassicaformis (strain CCMP3155) TaxID=1169540 RepID=A0A0G4EH30_VITBC|nr:unnamed protein product [Vitrella brassicaformis CCMP3155]|eukprot:CEL94674.1 unnamed protein product [Vitrella brassicaformis CCMP3155]